MRRRFIWGTACSFALTTVLALIDAKSHGDIIIDDFPVLRTSALGH